MTSKYANRTLGAKAPSTIRRRMRDLVRASPCVPTAGQNVKLFPKLITATRHLSDQAFRTSSRAKSGTRVDKERKETKRRFVRVGGTGKSKAYALCSLFPLASNQIGDLTPMPRP